jgi:serine/threonine protein kinase
MEDTYILENYEIVRQLGKGAMGTVFLVKRKSDDKLVALKKMIMSRDEYGNISAADLQQAKKEIDILQTVSSYPECNMYISCYYNHYIDLINGIIYLEMEYINGLTLNQYVEPFYETQDSAGLIEMIYVVAKAITLALQHIHDKGILHLDIKPENIMIDNNRVPKLVDFGVSCVTKPQGTDVCVLDKCCTNRGGSFMFLAPELVTRNVRYPKSDVWSLGATLYYICLKQFIWDINILDPMFLIKPLQEQTTLILQTIRNTNPELMESGIEKLDNLINGMTTKSIETRFSTADVLEFLELNP